MRRRGGTNAGRNPAGHPTYSMKTLPQLPADLFWESRTAETLGLSRTRIRELRKAILTPGADWQLRENAVVLTAAGVQKISAALAQPAAAGDSGQFQPEGVVAPVQGKTSPAVATRGPAALPPGPPPSAHFMVVRIPLHRKDRPQQRIIVARECAPGTAALAPWDVQRHLSTLGRERSVTVRDNKHFMPGMVLEAVEIGHGIWQYRGRLPRRPGKW